MGLTGVFQRRPHTNKRCTQVGQVQLGRVQQGSVEMERDERDTIMIGLRGGSASTGQGLLSPCVTPELLCSGAAGPSSSSPSGCGGPVACYELDPLSRGPVAALLAAADAAWPGRGPAVTELQLGVRPLPLGGTGAGVGAAVPAGGSAIELQLDLGPFPQLERLSFRADYNALISLSTSTSTMKVGDE
jgi:hypothetical protein